MVGGFGHPSKFQWVLRLGFVTTPTSLNGGQPNFAQCLAISLAGTLCTIFGGSCPLMEFGQVQNSLCIQVLRSPILSCCTALKQRASAKLCGIQQGHHLYSAGRPSRWASAHILVLLCYHVILILLQFKKYFP